MLTRLKLASALLVGVGLMTAAAGVSERQEGREKDDVRSKATAASAGVLKDSSKRESLRPPIPPYIVEPPDMLTISVASDLPGQPVGDAIAGEFLVRPDGRISLGYAGDIHVAGLTTDEIKVKIINHLREFLDDAKLGLVEEKKEGVTRKIPPERSKQVSVAVSSFNSKFYYVQGSFAKPGRFPVTGNETVLDAINFAGGLVGRSNRIDLIRPAHLGGGEPTVFPVNLDAIVKDGDPTTNYQILPFDRIVAVRNSNRAERFGNAEENENPVKGSGNSALETRLQAIEAKLDLLIEKMDRVHEKR